MGAFIAQAVLEVLWRILCCAYVILACFHFNPLTSDICFYIPFGPCVAAVFLCGADEVEEEIVDLEDCKKKLIEAKAKLKRLMAEKAEAEKKEAEAQADEDAK